MTLSVQEILRARALLPIPRRKPKPRRLTPVPESTGPQAERLRNWLISPPPAPAPPSLGPRTPSAQRTGARSLRQ
jgi:hypothetical protein